MEMDRGISRRRMLAMSAAAGGVALGGDVGRAFAQTDKRIEQLAPELDKIIATSEPIKELATGFGGPLGPAEGPLWWKEGGFLLFTDIHNSRRMKHVPGQAPTVDLEPSNRANGLTRDLQGRLLSCEHDTRPEQWDLTFAGVYRLTPDLGTLSLLVDNFVFPNGLAFTPDESVLYVNDTRRGDIRAFDVLPNGTLAKQSDRVFADLRGSEPGVPDGMKVDVAGNVYCGGAGGIWILDPQGKKLGRIVHGHPATTNIAFGGDDWKTLYFTSRTHLGSVNLKVAGLPVPAPKKTG